MFRVSLLSWLDLKSCFVKMRYIQQYNCSSVKANPLVWNDALLCVRRPALGFKVHWGAAEIKHPNTRKPQSCHFRFYQIIWTQLEYKASYFKHDLSCIDPQPLFDKCQYVHIFQLGLLWINQPLNKTSKIFPRRFPPTAELSWDCS